MHRNHHVCEDGWTEKNRRRAASLMEPHPRTCLAVLSCGALIAAASPPLADGSRMIMNITESQPHTRSASLPRSPPTPSLTLSPARSPLYSSSSSGFFFFILGAKIPHKVRFKKNTCLKKASKISDRFFFSPGHKEAENK